MSLAIPPYEGQGWTDDSAPDLSAETLNAVDAGITANSVAINAIANAVVSQIVNDPDKIASMAALFAVNQTVGNLSTTVTNLNSNLTNLTAVNVAYNSTGGNITASNVQSAVSQLDARIVNRGAYTGNLNDIPFVSNFITVCRAAQNSTNAPAADYGIVETLYVDSSSYAIQRFTSMNATPRLWVRSKINGTWNAWVEK